MKRFHGTTIVAVNRGGVTALVGDGQISLGDTIVKRGAVKVRSLSGVGDVISPDESVVAVGSGGPYAQAAAMALLRNTDLSAEEIGRQALAIAADIDVFTSGTATVLTVAAESDDEPVEELGGADGVNGEASPGAGDQADEDAS